MSPVRSYVLSCKYFRTRRNFHNKIHSTILLQNVILSASYTFDFKSDFAVVRTAGLEPAQGFPPRDFDARKATIRRTMRLQPLPASPIMSYNALCRLLSRHAWIFCPPRSVVCGPNLAGHRATSRSTAGRQSPCACGTGSRSILIFLRRLHLSQTLCSRKFLISKAQSSGNRPPTR